MAAGSALSLTNAGSVFALVASMTTAQISFVSRSLTPTTAVFPTDPRLVRSTPPRFDFGILRRFPRMYVLSASTAATNRLADPAAIERGIRCARGHAVFCVIETSWWSFMLDTLLRGVDIR